jgi:hypothetical protein
MSTTSVTTGDVVSQLVDAHNRDDADSEALCVKVIRTTTDPASRNAYKLALLDLLMTVKVGDVQKLARFCDSKGLLASDDIFVCLATRAEYLPARQAEVIDEAFSALGYSSEEDAKLRAYIKLQVKMRRQSKAAISKEEILTY